MSVEISDLNIKDKTPNNKPTTTLITTTTTTTGNRSTDRFDRLCHLIGWQRHDHRLLLRMETRLRRRLLSATHRALRTGPGPPDDRKCPQRQGLARGSV